MQATSRDLLQHNHILSTVAERHVLRTLTQSSVFYAGKEGVILRRSRLSEILFLLHSDQLCHPVLLLVRRLKL